MVVSLKRKMEYVIGNYEFNMVIRSYLSLDGRSVD